jgi:hypothetical protein
LAAIAEAEKILAGQARVPPYHRSPYLVSRLLLDVGKLESATAAGDRLEVRALATRARSSLRERFNARHSRV